MQDSIRINKPFTYHGKGHGRNECSSVAAKATVPANQQSMPGAHTSSTNSAAKHSRFITPQNIDSLILKLNTMEVSSGSHPVGPSPQLTPRGIVNPTTLYSPRSKRTTMFTEQFISQIPIEESPSSKEKMTATNNRKLWQQPVDSKRLQTRLAPIDTTKLSGASPLSNYPYRATTDQSHPLSIMDLLKRTNPLKVEATPVKPFMSASINPSHVNDKAPSIGIHHTACKPKHPRPLLGKQPAPPISTASSSSSGVLLGVDPDISDTNESDEEGDSDNEWIEDEEILSDINDDTTTTTGSILTNTSGIGMEDSEPDFVAWGMEGENDTEDDHSRGSMINGCGFDHHINILDVPMLPQRVMSIGEMVGSLQATPPLTPSLFPGRLPTIHFPLVNERYTKLSKDQRSLLKWKMSPITPNVVKRIIARVGFKPTSSNTRWIGYWGRHMRSEAFKEITPDQKVNHFPGSFNLGRKDKLSRNLFKMQAQHGKKDFNFIPDTYVLPTDLRNFKRLWDSSMLSGNTRTNKWIIKPPASARGIGIKVINKWSQVPKKRPVIVQRYISNPFLINGSKFDLRVYVYVSSFDPLIIYIYRDGLARFATVKYSKSSKKLSNRFMHLTNYSVNRHSSQFITNSDETLCYGHKWGLLALWGYFSDHLSIDPAPVWENIKDLVIKTIISCEGTISSLTKANVRHRRSVHELFGFDIMLDKNLKPWILEVNVSPSLHSNSSLDVNIKEVMLRDIFNMAQFKLPSSHESTTVPRMQSEDKTKHFKFTQKAGTEVNPQTILDDLSDNDRMILMDLEDEFSRRGSFIRVFPGPNVYSKYSKYFHIQRYYNILVNQWVTKHGKYPSEGICQLRKLAISSKK